MFKNRILFVLPLFLGLSGCNDISSNKSTSSTNGCSTSLTTTEKEVGITVEKLQEDSGPILYFVSQMEGVFNTTTLKLKAYISNSGSDKFAKALEKNGISSTYFNENKTEILSKINDREFKSGLSYSFPLGGISSETFVVDGKTTKFGYYVIAYKCLTGSKYHVTYREDNQNCEFDIWLPKVGTYLELQYYDNLDYYREDLNKYCLD